MSARSSFYKIAAKAGMLFGAIFVVTVLLAAIPAHQQQALQVVIAQEPAAAPSQDADHTAMPGMNMSDEKVNEKAAVNDMTPGHHEGHAQHMFMTSPRPRTPEDLQRAGDIVTQLRAGIEKYKDYHVALNDGFHIFLPNIPQPEYHFTSYRNGFMEAFTFDPARPTSLLYKKTATGYELVGAMFTMPKRANEEQLNARVPLSVAMWHLHTNLCMPRAPSCARRIGQSLDCTDRSPQKTLAMRPAGASRRSFSDGWYTSIPTKIPSTRSSPCTTTWTNRPFKVCVATRRTGP